MLRRRRLAEALLAVAVALVVSAALWRAEEWPTLRALETWSLDLRMRLRGERPPGAEVALVLVDDRSLEKLGRWPFSRRLLARATDVIDGMGAKVIAFDLLLSEPERPIPEALRGAAASAGRQLERRSPKLAAALAGLAADDPDAELAAALRRSGKVLIPFAFTFSGEDVGDVPALEAAAFASFGNSPRPPVFPLKPTAPLMPIPSLVAAAAGIGHVNVAFDADGAPRYEYLALPYRADYLPSLTVRALALFRGVDWSEVSLRLGGGVDIGGLAVPSDAAMRLLIDYRGPRASFPTHSFVDVVEGRVPADAFRGRIVLVGAAAIGVNDTFRTPFGSVPLPGVERMANVIDTALHGTDIGRPEALPLAEGAAVVAVAALAGTAGILLPTWSAAMVWLLVLAGWAAAAQWALSVGLWLSVAAPLAALAAAMVGVLGWRIVVVDREERRVRSAFRRYLAPAMVAELAAHPERLRLGGESRVMSVLFCDIRNFTTLSETMAEQDLVRLLNGFFTPAVDVVMAHHGTVDKFIGDCLMAFWGAPLADPDHALHACQAARSMLTVAEKSVGLAAFGVGIGLNTGPCCVGNLGSEQRFDYSVVGDAVNVASRMEGLTKTYGVRLVAAEGTRAAVPHLPWLVLDEVTVKGRAAPVRAHTLWDGPLEVLARLGPLHEAILTALAQGREAEADQALVEARSLAGERLAATHRILAARAGAKRLLPSQIVRVDG